MKIEKGDEQRRVVHGSRTLLEAIQSLNSLHSVKILGNNEIWDFALFAFRLDLYAG